MDGVIWPHEALKRFRLIIRAAQQHSQWVESRCGITSAKLWIMAEIVANPGQRVGDIAAAMAVHQSTISNLLLKLEKKSLIRRERCKDDQRVVRLYPTEAGLELVASAPKPLRGLLQNALFELPEEMLVALTQNLDALIEAMHIRDREAALEPLPLSLRSAEPSSAGGGPPPGAMMR